MLLRLEVDGFKNLVGLDVRFGPFNCIAGENGVGKSNVFDAIHFLSLIADKPLIEAAQEVRSISVDSVGEPEHLFTAGLDRRTMSFAVEMVVPSQVVDDFGAEAKPAITILRYELAIGYEEPQRPARQGRLVVEAEDLRHINLGDAHNHMLFPHSASKFRREIVTGRREGVAFVSTESTESEGDQIKVHQDGGSRGRPWRALPIGAERTVVSTINSKDDGQTVLAARREMESWQRLALEPSALRAADRFIDPSVLGSDGSHLASTLYRIATTTPEDEPEDVFARVANRVSGLAGVDIRTLRVDVDETRQLLTIVVADRQGRELPARSLSEGTLRYLALAVLLEDPTRTGLITMEEPENGIHPSNIGDVVKLARDLAVDTDYPPGPDNPLRQVIVNTHSPSVVQLVGEADLLHASEHEITRDGQRLRALQLRGMQGAWRDRDGTGATHADLLPYLAVPIGSQIPLFTTVA